MFLSKNKKKPIYSPMDPRFTVQKWDVRGCMLHGHFNMMMFSRDYLYPCRDHFFDKQERKRLRGKKKEAVMSFERNAVERGTLGVRYEKGRRNESKLLPTDRMGLDVDAEGYVCT